MDGAGLTYAKELARHGAAVVVNDIDDQNAAAAAAEIAGTTPSTYSPGLDASGLDDARWRRRFHDTDRLKTGISQQTAVFARGAFSSIDQQHFDIE